MFLLTFTIFRGTALICLQMRCVIAPVSLTSFLSVQRVEFRHQRVESSESVCVYFEIDCRRNPLSSAARATAVRSLEELHECVCVCVCVRACVSVCAREGGAAREERLEQFELRNSVRGFGTRRFRVSSHKAETA